MDQVAAAREVAKRRYVDRARIGIWGWVSLDIRQRDELMRTELWWIHDL